jgi:hypothetical protein
MLFFKFMKQLTYKLISVLLTLTIVLGSFAVVKQTTNAQEALENYSYSLSQSTADLKLWTTPPSERVFKDAPAPTAQGSSLALYAAKNETEPVQLVVNPTSTKEIAVSLDNLPSGVSAEIYQVKYVNISTPSDNLGQTGPYPDPLWPIGEGENVTAKANENLSFWISLNIENNAPAGEHQAEINLGTTSIPLIITIFDFEIPEELSIKSQMNFSFETMLQKYGVQGLNADYWDYVDNIKQFFIDRRLTPKSALWPGGLTSSGGAPFIEYNCLGQLTDPHGIWGFEKQANRYLTGEGLLSGQYDNQFNEGIGFPSFMAMTFRNNNPENDQRPGEFCDEDLDSGDWYGIDNPESSYNKKWFAYISALEDYLANQGLLDKAYHYFANEPGDQNDYDAVAWYSRYLKEAAPNFKLMVSEPPKPEIFNHQDYVNSGQIDIWLPVLHQFDPEVSADRAANHGEESWIYFLHGTRPPYFNPITLDHPGIESKLTGWFLWKYRLRGIAYYSLNNWSKNPWTQPATDGHNGDTFMLYPPSENNAAINFGATNHRFVTSIRMELMRDSLEDYEYLYLLNNQNQPMPGEINTADPQVDKIISGLTSYNRDSNFMYNLRRLIGLKLSGEISNIPEIIPEADNPRSNETPGNYYLNFQNPEGQPEAEPLVVNGKTYQKIGWQQYDSELGYGWFGDLTHTKYQYLQDAPNELQASIIYDDWGREKTFEYDLPNGTYNVTVSAGWQGRNYGRNLIEIEGVSFIDDEATDPYLVRQKQVTVNDQKLTLNMGIFDEYTMLNYLEIEAAEGQVDSELPDESKEVILSDISGTLYKEAIEYLVAAEVVNGYSDGTYRPNNLVNRAEIVKILTESTVSDFASISADYDFSCFPDVAEGEWYTPYVCYAKSQGIIQGYPNGNFQPADNVNLVEILKIIVNVYNVPLAPEGENWYDSYLDAMQTRNYIPASFIQLGQTVNRGEMAELVYRVLEDLRDKPAATGL